MAGGHNDLKYCKNFGKNSVQSKKKFMKAIRCVYLFSMQKGGITKSKEDWYKWTTIVINFGEIF